MAIADTITSMQTHTSNAYTMIGYGTDLTGINKNLENLSTSIFNAFLEALRTPDTLFTNLPKKSGSGANITLNDTANAPMRIELGASELSQDATPTPSSPQDIHTISGSNKVITNGKNLFNINNTLYVRNNNVSYSITGNTISLTNNDSGGNNYVWWNVPVEIGQNYTISYGDLVESLENANNYLAIKYSSTLITSWTSDLTTHTSIAKDIKYANFIPTQKYLIVICRMGNGRSYSLSNIQLELGTATTYEPCTSQEVEINLGTNLIGLDDAQYKVNLKAGDKIFATNQSSSGLTLQLYTNYGDSTRNDYWSVGANSTRAITVGYDTKAMAWSTIIPRPYIAWVNLGSTQLPYNDYIEPINYSKIGNYEDKFIRTSGKNLINRATCTENNVLVWTTGNDYATSQALTSDFIKVSANEKYSLNYFASIFFYDSSKTYLGCLQSGETTIAKQSGTTTKSLTVINDSSIAYMRLVFRPSAENNNTDMTTAKIMLNKGSTALDYEPYGSNEWYIKKNIGKYVFTGNETFSNTSTRTNTFRFTYTIVDKLPNATNSAIYMYCNRGRGTPDYYWSRDEVGVCEGRNSTMPLIIFSLPISEVSSVAEAKTWFTNNETIIDYVLATPTYTQITGTLAEQLENVYQKLLSYSGTTNISQVNNDLSFELSVSAIEV